MYLTARGKTRDTLRRERNVFQRCLEKKGTANTHTHTSPRKDIQESRKVSGSPIAVRKTKSSDHSYMAEG